MGLDNDQEYDLYFDGNFMGIADHFEVEHWHCNNAEREGIENEYSIDPFPSELLGPWG